MRVTSGSVWNKPDSWSPYLLWSHSLACPQGNNCNIVGSVNIKVCRKIKTLN